MIVRIKFIDGSISEYDISMTCELLDELTKYVEVQGALWGFWVNWNPVTKECTDKSDLVTVINTRNIVTVTLLKIQE